MSKAEYSGKLIVFCGLDGSGKTTMINRLNDYLSKKNQEVLLTKQPTQEMRKNHVFRAFQDTPNVCDYDYRALSLVAASDRLQHNTSVIKPALKMGKIVISDRYFYSCLANLQARGYMNDMWIYDIAKNIICPDLSFFLDVDVETAITRIRKRPEEKYNYIDLNLQYELKKNYLNIAKSVNGIVVSTNNKTVEESFSEIQKNVDNLF